MPLHCVGNSSRQKSTDEKETVALNCIQHWRLNVTLIVHFGLLAMVTKLWNISSVSVAFQPIADITSCASQLGCNGYHLQCYQIQLDASPTWVDRELSHL